MLEATATGNGVTLVSSGNGGNSGDLGMMHEALVYPNRGNAGILR